MKKYAGKTPEEVIKLVTLEIIERSIKLGEKKNGQYLLVKHPAVRELTLKH